jgi:outer membrane protein assembly factor BamB
LQLTAVGQAPKNVVQVGRLADQASAGVASCSIERDRAVVANYASSGNTVQFWVVQLSTGRILWTRPSGDIRSSRDGQYIAEISYDQTTRNSTTTIYSPSGAVLGNVAGRVEAFSWDGSLAVQMADNNGPVSVIRWRDGTVLWSGPTDGGYIDAMPEPGGQRIAISVRDPQHPQTGGFPPRNVYVVGPDGQAIELLKNVM